jgi:quinol monooxygenase YgiN
VGLVEISEGRAGEQSARFSHDGGTPVAANLLSPEGRQEETMRNPRTWKILISCVMAGVAVLVLVSARSSAQGTAKSVGGEGAVCLNVMYTIRAGHEEEAVDDLRNLAAETQKEPGNLMYLIHRSVEDPRKFLIYEQYRSQAALETHLAKDYFQRYSVNGLRKIAESRVAGTYRPL